MEHNRRGLALMVAALLISILAVSVRSCNDTHVVRLSELEVKDAALRKNIYALAAPIKDFSIKSIENGGMTVEAGPSLAAADLKTLAVKLTRALFDADHEALHSDMVMVDVERDGKVVCKAQTTPGGVWVKLL